MAESGFGATKAEDLAEAAQFPMLRLDPACTGKRRFISKGEALRSLRKRKGWRRRISTKQSNNVHPYRCRACHGWHVGGDFR